MKVILKINSLTAEQIMKLTTEMVGCIVSSVQVQKEKENDKYTGNYYIEINYVKHCCLDNHFN